MPRKKHREGIEMFVLAEALTGFLFDFEYLAKNPIETYEIIEIPEPKIL